MKLLLLFLTELIPGSPTTLSILLSMLLLLFLTELIPGSLTTLRILLSMLLLLFESESGSALPLPTSMTCNVVVGFHVMLLMCRMEDKGGGEVMVIGGGGGDWGVGLQSGGGWCWVVGDRGDVVVGGVWW